MPGRSVEQHFDGLRLLYRLSLVHVDEAWRRALHRHGRPVLAVEVRAPAGDALQLFAGRTLPVQVVVDLALVGPRGRGDAGAPLLGKIALGVRCPWLLLQ
jgi:hypothetical protein